MNMSEFPFIEYFVPPDYVLNLVFTVINSPLVKTWQETVVQLKIYLPILVKLK